MDSVAQFHPELARFVILVDQPDGFFDPANESFTVVASDSLGLPDGKWFHFKYTLLELSTAVKPYAIDHLFREFDFDFVLFLDPDILVCSDLNDVLARLDNDSLLLTPHLTAPIFDDKRPSELDILRAGVYNLGFFAIARNQETLAFLQWWKERLYDYCVVDLPRGLFLDQRWADFAPCFVSRVGVLRDPAYNVAYWNLHHRQLSLSEGVFLVNGSPLRFFHFSGFDPDHAERLSKHQNRYRSDDLPVVQSLVEQYSRLLHHYGYRECCRWPYAYGFFNNGIRIPDVGRSLPFESPSITSEIGDPFTEEGYKAFVQIWNEPLEETDSSRPITRLAYRLYRTRNDLQTAMPNIFGGDYREFVRWLTSAASRDHDLPDVLLAPFKRVPGAGTAPDISRDVRQAPSTHFKLTRLAHQIYNKRPDLQGFFPDPEGKDAAKYLVWLLSYGKRRYALSEVYLRTLRLQWQAEIDRLPNHWVRLWYRMLLAGSVASAAVTPVLGPALGVPSWLRAQIGKLGRWRSTLGDWNR